MSNLLEIQKFRIDNNLCFSNTIASTASSHMLSTDNPRPFPPAVQIDSIDSQGFISASAVAGPLPVDRDKLTKTLTEMGCDHALLVSVPHRFKVTNREKFSIKKKFNLNACSLASQLCSHREATSTKTRNLFN